MKKFLFFLLLVVGYSCLAWTWQEKQSTAKSILEKIPVEDRFVLEGFLQKIIGHDQIGFALFGSKPAACSGYFKKTSWKYFLYSSNYEIQKIEFLVWKKYKHLFQNENFHWMQRKESKEIRVIGFTILNKKKFLKTVTENLEIFQKELGRKVMPESLYEELCASDDDLFQSLQKNVALEGILLGFGRQSSLVYKRRDELDNCLKPKPPLCKTEAKPYRGFATIEEEYAFLDNKFFTYTPYRDRWCIIKMTPVRFMNLDTKEARALRKKYSQDAETINKFFEGKSYLEVTLEQIWAKEPISLD